MPTDNNLILLGMGLAAFWMFQNRNGSQEGQVDQLTGAAMMASGEGTNPDAPFSPYSTPTNPVFFWNRGGGMSVVPEQPVELAATYDEDIGVYPGGKNVPELHFTMESSQPPPGTSDTSPTTPEFEGDEDLFFSGDTPRTPPDDAAADARKTLFIDWGPVSDPVPSLWGASEDISNLDSKEKFVAVQPDNFQFTTSLDVLGEYVQGFTATPPGPVTNAAVVNPTPYVDVPWWHVDAEG